MAASGHVMGHGRFPDQIQKFNLSNGHQPSGVLIPLNAERTNSVTKKFMKVKYLPSLSSSSYWDDEPMSPHFRAKAELVAVGLSDPEILSVLEGLGIRSKESSYLGNIVAISLSLNKTSLKFSEDLESSALPKRIPRPTSLMIRGISSPLEDNDCPSILDVNPPGNAANVNIHPHATAPDTKFQFRIPAPRINGQPRISSTHPTCSVTLPKSLDATAFKFFTTIIAPYPPIHGYGSFLVEGSEPCVDVNPSDFTIRITSPSGAILEPYVEDDYCGATFTFYSNEKGIHRISVCLTKYGGQHIVGSPFTIDICQAEEIPEKKVTKQNTTLDLAPLHYTCQMPFSTGSRRPEHRYY